MKYFALHSFTNKLFSGNPAGVCLLESWPDDATMQKIARENNVSETAFLLQRPDKAFDLRWFAPDVEVDLCGHATLAGAFVIFNFTDYADDTIDFYTKSGKLSAAKDGERVVLDFPAKQSRPVGITELMRQAVGKEIKSAHLSDDLMLVLDDENAVRSAEPDLIIMNQFKDCRGIIITAKGEDHDFVSRFFAPGLGITEDPVTGSAHSVLIPYWSNLLGKDILVAEQVSQRGGVLYCQNCGERVKFAGNAALYLSGEINIT